MTMKNESDETSPGIVKDPVEAFFKEYEGEKPGNPRFMALWDAVDLYRCNSGIMVGKPESGALRRGDSEEQLRLIEERIEIRSSEIPGYYLSLIEATDNLEKTMDKLGLEGSDLLTRQRQNLVASEMKSSVKAIARRKT